MKHAIDMSQPRTCLVYGKLSKVTGSNGKPPVLTLPDCCNQGGYTNRELLRLSTCPLARGPRPFLLASGQTGAFNFLVGIREAARGTHPSCVKGGECQKASG